MSLFKNIGGVGIMGYISPMHVEDTYAVIDPIYGVDGLRNVNSMEELNSISTERRRAGMIVGVDGGLTYYKLKNVSWVGDETDWEELDLTRVRFVDKEIPGGLINGENNVYTLAYTPIPGSEHLYLNGLLQESGLDNDYTIVDSTITFYDSPMEDMVLKCSYRRV
jgi:hypothetical protein